MQRMHPAKFPASLGLHPRAIAPSQVLEDLLTNREVKDSQFMDALEYGRIMHAEMSAICDAARIGHVVKDAVLYCTTFPCHMCAKHIVGVGISKVVFLEPYQKSLAYDLHTDSIQIEGNDRGRYNDYPAVRFEHFYGVTPRRYREIFERGRRKSEDGHGPFLPYQTGEAKPLVSIPYPYYERIKEQLTTRAVEIAIKKLYAEKDKLTEATPSSPPSAAVPRIMEASVDPSIRGSRLNADHPEKGVLFARRFTMRLSTVAPDIALRRGDGIPPVPAAWTRSRSRRVEPRHHGLEHQRMYALSLG